ncbi:MAG: hypothetical protein OEZ22_13150 [Spirochaetia bacterium]|nr:hypothetical protein [Spirochaetia bacterium]
MSHMNSIFCGLFLIISSFFPKDCLANDGVSFHGPDSGPPFIGEHTEVFPESEKSIYKDNTFVTVFKFKNNSNKEVKVKIGFPINGDICKATTVSDSSPEIHRDYFIFNTRINGCKVKRMFDVQKINNQYYQSVFHTELSFIPFEGIAVKKEYIQEPIRASFAELCDYSEINYIVEAGKTCRGKIKEAEFVFYAPLVGDKMADKVYHESGEDIRIKKYSFLSYYPNTHKKEIKNDFNVIRYRFNNIDLGFNFRINWDNFHIEDSTIKGIDFYSYINQYLTENNRNYNRLSKFIDKYKQDKYESTLYLMRLEYLLHYT